MKRFFILFFCLIIVSSFSLFACNNSESCVNLKYYQRADEIIPLLNHGTLDFALLPEPALSSLKKISTDKEWFSLSLQDLYDETTKSYPQAVMMVKESILSTYPNLVNYISSTFDSGVSWVKDNCDTAVSSINSVLDDGLTPSLKSGMQSQTVENCNIYFESSESAKNSVKAYINSLIELDSISCSAVSDDFFYDNNVEKITNNQQSLTVVCPDGAPALSIAKYINDNDDFNTGKQVNYKVVSADRIASYIVKGSGDIVIIPINASSKIYSANKNEKYKMVSVVTHGNLYIVSSSSISLNDLVGKTVGVIGQGLVPDLTFKSVLKKNNLKFEIAV